MGKRNRLAEFEAEARREWLELQGHHFDGACYMIEKSSESPIEQMFALALYARQGYGDSTESWEQQVQIGKYRVDFLLRYVDEYMEVDGKKDLTPAQLVVELDGHDFHERTKEQAQRDKSRDRALTDLGYHVIRFTGSEVYADPMKCAKEASGLVGRLYYQRVLGPVEVS